MHITEAIVSNIPPFTVETTFVFDEKVNVLIGPNGTGKSTLMKLISDFPRFGIPGYRDGSFSIRMSSDWPSGPNRRPDPQAVPWVYIPAIRLCMPISRPNSKVALSRGLQEIHELDEILAETPYTFFNGERVYHAMKQIAEEDLQRRNSSRSIDIATVVYNCTKDICGELLVGASPRHYVGTEKLTDTQSDLSEMPVVHYGMAVVTSDGGEQDIYIGDLSSGTQITYLWIWYLALRISTFYNYTADWQNKNAVLMIDEIENHLHPKWQRRVILALLKHFPGLQIFATTHSPFVVAGRKEGQVNKLFRNESGTVCTEPNKDEIQGWTIEQILREFMEVEDPTDDETALAAGALRWLRHQAPTDSPAEEWKKERLAQLQGIRERTDDETNALLWLQRQGELPGAATAWWTSAIENLRTSVSPALEAGGPFAAQRELFLKQLDDMLQEEDENDPVGEKE